MRKKELAKLFIKKITDDIANEDFDINSFYDSKPDLDYPKNKKFIELLDEIFPDKESMSKLCLSIAKAIHKRELRDINCRTISKKESKYPDRRINNFKDALFNIDNEKREIFAILKLLKNDDIWFLCNNTYSWIAVNIPLNICGSNIEGDIDILIAMTIFPKGFPENPKGKVKNIYRTFEVKTSKIDKNGNCKSLKFGKFDRTKKQLYKLNKSGSQQTFLLTIFLLESGYHNNFDKLPESLVSLVEEKIKEIKNEEFGYVCTFLEQQSGWDENNTPPMMHKPKSLKPANINKLNNPIKKIVKCLEKYWKENKVTDFSKVPFIAYCSSCKKLNILNANDSSYKCKHCQKNIFK
ncbi:MAG: hypothetical protein WC470_02205 [Candidatus Paceibacterota bacterium]